MFHSNITSSQVKEPSDLGTVCSCVQRQGFATLQQVPCFHYKPFSFVSFVFVLLTLLQWVRDIDLIWANALLCVVLSIPVSFLSLLLACKNKYVDFC
jgi:hypothetical protein